VPFSTLIFCLAFTLGADPPSASPASPLPLPRSSIAAVLALRGELGLDAVQVKQLEDRDSALQKQTADLRDQLEAATSRSRAGGGQKGGRPSGAGEAAPPAMSPSDAAHPEDGGGGGRHGGGMSGRHGGGGRRAALDPGARAADLQGRIDDADTAAWLAAEPLLREPQRERARAVAEKYREALADEREAKRAGH
jgi:hypothetical protein